jgi:hypothetical protein
MYASDTLRTMPDSAGAQNFKSQSMKLERNELESCESSQRSVKCAQLSPEPFGCNFHPNDMKIERQMY